MMCFILEIVSSSGSGASVGSEMLVDKSRLAPKKDKFQARSNSPSPRDSPGWLKLKSNAEHQDDFLMREKALLFSDYHQPFNFLYHEKEKPNTSLESVYGGSDFVPPKSSSSSSKQEPAPLRRARPESGRRPVDDSVRPRVPAEEGPRSKRNSYPPSNRKTNEVPVKKPPPKLNSKQNTTNKKNGNNGSIMPKNLTETGSTSMEWDPYYLNTKKKEEEKNRLERKPSNSRRRSRNISPISEEDTAEPSTDKPLESLVPNVGSDEGTSDIAAASGSSYPLNTSDTSDSVTPPQRKLSHPQKAPQKVTPPRRTSPPQRVSPPQRSTQHANKSPPSKGEGNNSGESKEASPPSSGRSEKSDKHTQFDGRRR